MELRRHIGYVIQQIGLFPNMTVAQNICVVPNLLKYSKEACDKIVHELLELVNLPYEQYAHKYPSEMSGGQQQRIGILRALAASPPIVLMDEPFSALDPMTRRTLQQEVRSLQQQLRLPPVFAYGLLAAWGILPNMMEEYKRTRAAFAARGIRVFPVSPALLKPLLVKSVRWSEELSIAMESRGFDGRAPRTCSQPLRLRPVDVLFPILSCALFLALFFLLGR